MKGRCSRLGPGRSTFGRFRAPRTRALWCNEPRGTLKRCTLIKSTRSARFVQREKNRAGGGNCGVGEDLTESFTNRHRPRVLNTDRTDSGHQRHQDLLPHRVMDSVSVAPALERLAADVFNRADQRQAQRLSPLGEAELDVEEG